MARAELFRIGPGYVYMWAHLANEHCQLSARERTAIAQFNRSLGQQIRMRDEVESARRAFIPVSLLATPTVSVAEREVLADTTKRFFLHAYSLISDLASIVVRFPGIFGNVPSRSNARFIEWLETGEFGLMQEHFAAVRAARDFRTLLDHTASFQPYEWGTARDQHGFVRAMVHGPKNREGGIPQGSSPVTPHGSGGRDDAWIFPAPDEDVVLTLLAVQINAVVSWLQVHRPVKNDHLCSWEPRLGSGDPQSGYPILAVADGDVVASGKMGLQLTEEDQATIDAVLGKYLNGDDADSTGP